MAIFRQVLKNARGQVLGVYEYEAQERRPDVCCDDHKGIKGITITTTDVTNEVTSFRDEEHARREIIKQDLLKNE